MALSFMRRHRRWLLITLWLVIAAFVVLYIPTESAQEGSPTESLGRVGPLPISAGEFRRAYAARMQMLRDRMGGRLDPALLRNLRVEDGVFDSLVQDKLILLEAERLGLKVDDDTLAREISENPFYQREGKFIGGAELRRRLGLAGMSVKEFEEDQRTQILARLLRETVTAGERVSPQEAERTYRRRNETLRVEYVQADHSVYRASVTASSEEIETRFRERREDYRLPDKRVISFLLVDPEVLRTQVVVTEADTRSYYEDHKEEFAKQEEICARHILIRVKQDPRSTEGHTDEEAQRVGDELLAKLKAGADFDQSARESSDDVGSAARGGDLGCFTRGRMVREFEGAAFGMEEGETSDLVKSDFGYHIIRVTGKTPEHTPPYAEFKERVTQLVTAERVRALGREKVDLVRVALGRGDSLEDVALEEGLTVQKSEPFSLDKKPGPLGSARLATRAFALKAGEIESEGLQVQTGYVFFALADEVPSRLPELDEVRERIQEDLLREKAHQKAREAVARVRQRAARVGLDRAARAADLVRKETPTAVGRGQALGDLGTSLALDEHVFEVPENTLSEPVRTPRGWAVLRVIEKSVFDAADFEKEKESLVTQLTEERQRRLFDAYLGLARQRTRVERRPDVFKRLVG